MLTLRQQLLDALIKDSGPLGDVTTLALVKKKTIAHAELVVKAPSGVISGLEIVRLIFEIIDPKIKFDPLLRDGAAVRQGDKVATIQGNAQRILNGERVALEFIRRLSGIATKTRLFVDAVAGTGAVILDTRKVLPGYAELDKKAVRDGGGTNHRTNLSEMGLIKNNHIDLLNGDIAKAIKLFKKKYPDIPLEVEVRNQAELISALKNFPDRILLDNMDNKETKMAVKTRNEFTKETGKRIPLEASGNMTLDRVRSVAETGVDFISVGALTHSVEAFDISLHINFNR